MREYKPGIQTSELWVTVFGVAGIIWAGVQQNCNISPMVWAGVAFAVITYIWSRTKLKS